MPTTILSSSELQTRLKTLWGARSMPFGARVTEPYQTPGAEAVRRQIEQLLHVHASGVLHGPNGVGKTVLVEQVIAALSEKLFSVVRLTHSSLPGSDLLRSLSHALGLRPQMRRSDNVAQILTHWRQLQPVQAVTVLDEAQNLGAAALEELRLLGCAAAQCGADSYSLLLVGDEDLLPRLQMGVNRPLRARLGFCLSLPGFSAEQSEQYLSARWREVGVTHCPIEPPACLLLHQASGGVARTLNQLAQWSLIEAAQTAQHTIRTEHVQQAIHHLPWVTVPRGNETR
jgi:type II secretory pathway predicted ATPase ExeA